MSPTNTKHPTPEKLRQFGLGQLEPDELARVEEHISHCDVCCQSLGAIGDDTLLAGLKNCDTSIPETIDSARVQKRQQAANDSGIPVELVEHPRYRVVEQLGKGGMGVVYKAEHRLMQRPVALKVINHRLVQNATAVERFRLEVRAAAKLDHANIVTAHDAEQAGSIHFLVMEYVDGIDLAKQVQKSGPLPVRHACHFARQVASGLQQAFTKGMVHRDIKPQNIMLTREGRIKILDFGLARLASEADVDSEAAKLTKHGVMLGTPDYMSPEQILDSRQADIRADIYSLGCTLYFLLTGQPPFPNGSAVDKMTSHLKLDPPAIQRNDIPQELVEVIDRMMAKRVEDRFQSPQEIVDALQPFCKSATPASQPTVAAPPKPLVPDIDPLATPIPTVEHVASLPYAAQAAAAKNKMLRQYRAPLLAGGAVLLLATICVLAAGPVRRAVTQPESHPIANSNESIASRPRVAIVVPRNQLYFPDYEKVAQAFGDRAEIIVASSRTGNITDHTGNHTIAATQTLAQLDLKQLDAIVFTGAMDPQLNLEFLPQHDYSNETKAVIDSMARDGKCVTSLCAGNAVLASHGVLAQKHAAWTTYMPADQDAYPGIQWRESPGVYPEGRVITATSADQSQDFVEEILAALAR